MGNAGTTSECFKNWDSNSITRELHNLPHRFSSFIFRETMLSKVCCFHFQCHCVWFDVWEVTQVLVLKIVQWLQAVGSLHQTHLPANQQGQSHLLPAGFNEQEQEFLRNFRPHECPLVQLRCLLLTICGNIMIKLRASASCAPPPPFSVTHLLLHPITLLLTCQVWPHVTSPPQAPPLRAGESFVGINGYKATHLPCSGECGRHRTPQGRER